jgi:hypothetical protein
MSHIFLKKYKNKKIRRKKGPLATVQLEPDYSASISLRQERNRRVSSPVNTWPYHLGHNQNVRTRGMEMSNCLLLSIVRAQTAETPPRTRAADRREPACLSNGRTSRYECRRCDFTARSEAAAPCAAASRSR